MYLDDEHRKIVYCVERNWNHKWGQHKQQQAFQRVN